MAEAPSIIANLVLKLMEIVHVRSIGLVLVIVTGKEGIVINSQVLPVGSLNNKAEIITKWSTRRRV
jgi:hypothetical protein